MNNVDLIIKYLSKEMNPEDTGLFEKELASNPDIRKEFEEVSSAYYLIRDELRKKDEEAFRSKLREVMDAPRENIRNSNRRRPGWYFFLAIAGSLAILMTIFLVNRGSDQLFSQFFKPAQDPVLLAFNQETRGEAKLYTNLYHRGHIEESRNKSRAILEADPDNRIAILYYLLSSIELDLEAEALLFMKPLEITAGHRLDQSIAWYRSLALLKSGRKEEAVAELQTLEHQPGPYKADAQRLKKMLLK